MAKKAFLRVPEGIMFGREQKDADRPNYLFFPSSSMNSNEVNSFAKALKSALCKGPVSIRLSRIACVAESSSILAVVNGLRISCLLFTLTASHCSLIALQSILNQFQFYQVSVVVHQASQQLFIVHRPMFLQRWKEICRRDLFFAIDEGEKFEHNRIQVSKCSLSLSV